MKDGRAFCDALYAMQVRDLLTWTMLRGVDAYRRNVVAANKTGRTHRTFSHKGRFYVVRVE